MTDHAEEGEKFVFSFTCNRQCVVTIQWWRGFHNIVTTVMEEKTNLRIFQICKIINTRLLNNFPG